MIRLDHVLFSLSESLCGWYPRSRWPTRHEWHGRLKTMRAAIVNVPMNFLQRLPYEANFARELVPRGVERLESAITEGSATLTLWLYGPLMPLVRDGEPIRRLTLAEAHRCNAYADMVVGVET